MIKCIVFELRALRRAKNQKFSKLLFLQFWVGLGGIFFILKLFCSIKFFDKMHSFCATRSASKKKNLNFSKLDFQPFDESYSKEDNSKEFLKKPCGYLLSLNLFSSITFFDKMHSFCATRSASRKNWIFSKLFFCIFGGTK